MHCSLRGSAASLMLALGLVVVPAVALGAPPQVNAIIEGADTSSETSMGRVLIFVGNRVSLMREGTISQGGTDIGELELLVRSRNVTIFRLPAALTDPGLYDVALRYGSRSRPKFVEVVADITFGAPESGSIHGLALNSLLKADLDDAATLGGLLPDFFLDADNVNAGTLGTEFFSALDDLGVEGAIGSGIGQLATGDHAHDTRYVPRTDLASAAGTINDSANPVDWTQLKGVPAELTDSAASVDTAGDGLVLSGTTLSAEYAGSSGEFGSATSLSRSDHLHDDRYRTESELMDAGTINDSANPVAWTKLNDVPAGFADGVDADTLFTAGAGLLLTSEEFAIDFVGTGSATTVSRSDHDHDDRYRTESELADAGTLNDSSNPVNWTKLQDVPSGFADGTDEDTTYSAGAGLGLTGTSFAVTFGGTGSATTSSRTDHDHDSTYATLAHDHDTRYFEQSELSDAGTLNDTGNPVDWSKLKGVPAGLADGTDDDTQYTAGSGLSLSTSEFAVLFGGTGSTSTAARSDHDHDSDYATAAHDHSSTYFTQIALKTPGTLNETGNPMEWTKLKNVPTGLGDGDDDTQYSAGDGLDLSGTTFATLFSGTGAATSSARSDHGHDSTYSAAAHDHAADYFTKSDLMDAGTFNASTNPLDWTKLKNAPTGLGDGDDDTQYTAGDGLDLSGTTFETLFSGAGSATTSARSDHDHDSTYSAAAHDHASDYFTKSDLMDAGTFNASTNPLDWTKLKNAPTGLGDGDDDTQYTAGDGLDLSGTTFATLFSGTGSAASSARSDHGHDSTYSAAAHDHASAYFTKSDLMDAGTFNASTNPLDWTKLKNAPTGLGDGDDDTQYTAGDGLDLSGTTFATLFSGTGSATSSARSDHGHDSTYSAVAHDHASDYFTKSDLMDAGTFNDTGNPLEWTKLKNVPGDLEDGDNDTTYGAIGPIDLTDGDFSLLYTSPLRTDGSGRLTIYLGYGLSEISGRVLVDFYGTGSATTASRSDHNHGTDYFTKSDLMDVGTFNDTGNPLEWTKLKNVPGDLADGDDDTTYGASGPLELRTGTFSLLYSSPLRTDGLGRLTMFLGEGLADVDGTVEVAFSGTGSATTASRSDHDHSSDYFTRSDLMDVGTFNDTGNPLEWTKLKSVPTGLGDGDDDTQYSAGDGLDLSGTTFETLFSGTGAATTSARSDHDHDSTYSAVAHDHASDYFTKSDLMDVGTFNDTGNPLEWTKLKNVPTGLGDGDDDTQYSAGDGLDLSGTTFETLFSGTGAATTSARSDHAHDSTYSAVAHDHASDYFTKSDLMDVGTFNDTGNPMDWTKLKNVPTGLDDGDDDTQYTAGDGLDLSGTTFETLFSGTGAATTSARSDHDHDSTYSAAAHDHASAYFTKSDLMDVGTFNDTGNPLEWTKLKNVPTGLDDGDDDTQYTAGDGLDLSGTTFETLFSGTGAATTSARSDHDHDSTYSAAAHDHASAYFTKSDLMDVGTFNDTGNPLEWTKLKNVPTGLGDGDDDTQYAAGDGLDLSGTTFSTVFSGTGSATSSARSDHGHADDFVATTGDSMTGALDVTTAATSITGSSSSTTLPAVRGDSTSNTGAGVGLFGSSKGTVGVGVHGRAIGVAGNTIGVLGETVSQSGTGVFGRMTQTSGLTVGVRGEVASSAGTGVEGENFASSGTNYGVLGANRAEGAGVRGETTKIIGAAHGVEGVSVSSGGAGVRGQNLVVSLTGGGDGVFGITRARLGAGVYGENTASVGDSVGVRGVTGTGSGFGVQGNHPSGGGSGAGVRGLTLSSGGTGVFGEATNATGTAYGVRGLSSSVTGSGVLGRATHATGAVYGIRGEATGSGGQGVAGIATAASGFTEGVYGLSSSTQGLGVYGLSTASTGSTFGVKGNASSSSGTGVRGFVNSATGSTIGVDGDVNSSSGYGVRGKATATSGNTRGVSGESFSTTGAGVYGRGATLTGASHGVFGETPSTAGTGVRGKATATTGSTVGVHGEAASAGGVGVFAAATVSTGNALVADLKSGGTSSTTVANIAMFQVDGTNKARIDNTGQGLFNGGTATSGADWAESVEVDAPKSEFEPGDVIVVSLKRDRTFALSTESESKLVAGIYSTRPGMLARPGQVTDPSQWRSIEIPLAITGIVPCKVCDEGGPIRRGDLLVSASLPGHAKRAGEDVRPGTLVGKALGSLESGTGKVEVLITIR